MSSAENRGGTQDVGPECCRAVVVTGKWETPGNRETRALILSPRLCDVKSPNFSELQFQIQRGESSVLSKQNKTVFGPKNTVKDLIRRRSVS